MSASSRRNPVPALFARTQLGPAFRLAVNTWPTDLPSADELDAMLAEALEDVRDLLPRCAWCGEPFLRLRSDAKYCTDSHKTLAYRARRAEALRIEGPGAS